MEAQMLKSKLMAVEPASVLEMLFEYYREQNRPETEVIRENFAHMSHILEKLPHGEMDLVWDRICDLCIAYQRMAFLDGLGIGAKLMIELQ